MGILDLLFDGEDDPEVAPVTVRQMQPADWIATSSAIAGHQALQDGFLPGTNKVNASLRRPALSTKGVIDVSRSLRLSNDYRKMIINDQLLRSEFRPTADDVIDGGIKNGAKIVLEIIPEHYRGRGIASVDGIVRNRLREIKSGNRLIGVYFDKFSVTSVTEPEAERYQIHETFGGNILQVFGSRPVMLTITGQVLNGRFDVSINGEIRSMDWKNALQRKYKEHFSATQCVRKKKILRIFAQDTIYDGYLLNMVSATDANQQSISSVTLTYLVVKISYTGEKDELIPGTIQSNAFRLTGKATTDELFPQAKLEDYFEEDSSKILTLQKEIAEEEYNELRAQILSIAGGNFDIDSNVNSSIPLDDRYEAIIDDVKLHKVVDGSNLQFSWLQYRAQLSKLRDDIRDHNQSFFNSDEEKRIVAVTPFSETQGLLLEKRLSKLRAQRIGLARTTNTINSLCEQLIGSAKYRNSTVNIKSLEAADIDTLIRTA